MQRGTQTHTVWRGRRSRLCSRRTSSWPRSLTPTHGHNQTPMRTAKHTEQTDTTRHETNRLQAHTAFSALASLPSAFASSPSFTVVTSSSLLSPRSVHKMHQNRSIQREQECTYNRTCTHIEKKMHTAHSHSSEVWVEHSDAPFELLRLLDVGQNRAEFQVLM